MNSVTFRTLPFSIFQGQVVVDISAGMTAFARWEESVYFNDTATVPFAFVLEHINKRIPPTITDRLSKAMILDHIFDGKAFNMNSLVFANKLFACFMKKVLPLIRDLFMLPRKICDSFLSTVRTFDFSGYAFLKPSKPFFRFAEKLRWLNHFGFGRGNKGLDTEVEPNFTAHIGRLRNIQLAKDRGVIFPRRCFGNSNGLHNAFNCSMKYDLNALTFRDIKSIIFNIKSLWNSKGLFVLFLFEVRKFGTFVKEIVIGYIEITQRLLKRLSINLSKPVRFALVFKLSKCKGCIMVRQALLVIALIGSIIVNALSEEIVIYKSNATKMFFKNLALYSIRIYSEFEGFIDFHTYNYNTESLECHALLLKGVDSPPA